MDFDLGPYIGTASWTIPPGSTHEFPGSIGDSLMKETHLQRYARKLNGVEINTSFYRDHKPETYQKWALSVPESFRFSVKLSRYFTQDMRLLETGPRLREVVEGMKHLGPKLGFLLVQLPPSLDFRAPAADRFLKDLRAIYDGPLGWEPRHESWNSRQAVDVLSDYEVSRVLADPDPCPIGAAARSRLESVTYFRLHGSPEIYKSKYSLATIDRVAQRLEVARSAGRAAWCIFDNTTFGFATENALELKSGLSQLSKRLESSTKGARIGIGI
jgi:uncharacterized protein YecE (DUF72 family)